MSTRRKFDFVNTIASR